MNRPEFLLSVTAALLLSGCGSSSPPAAAPKPAPAAVEYFHVDGSRAGTITGHIAFHGTKPQPKQISMDSDAGCPHTGIEDTVVVSKAGDLANAFVYIQAGLEGKKFEPPATPVTLNQHGCMYEPRVLGLVAGQPLSVKNSDQVSHNVHPMPANNREWSEQQSPGAPDIEHKFPRADVMIPVKCNVHSWMHAFIGVLDHPYFAVTGPSGAFEIKNVPPGDYTLAAWHETLGEVKQSVHIDPSGKAAVNLSYP
jgi:plastocyanin